MDILHRGQAPEDRIVETTCRRCGSVLRFRQSEGTVTHDQREGSFVEVGCPVCGGRVFASL